MSSSFNDMLVMAILKNYVLLKSSKFIYVEIDIHIQYYSCYYIFIFMFIYKNAWYAKAYNRT